MKIRPVGGALRTDKRTGAEAWRWDVRERAKIFFYHDWWFCFTIPL